MPRKESMAVPEGIGPVPRQEFGPDQPTLADVYRLLKKDSNGSGKKIRAF